MASIVLLFGGSLACTSGTAPGGGIDCSDPVMALSEDCAGRLTDASGRGEKDSGNGGNLPPPPPEVSEFFPETFLTEALETTELVGTGFVLFLRLTDESGASIDLGDVGTSDDGAVTSLAEIDPDDFIEFVALLEESGAPTLELVASDSDLRTEASVEITDYVYTPGEAVVDILLTTTLSIDAIATDTGSAGTDSG